MVNSKFLAKFQWGKGGDDGGGVDPLAKHQIRGSKEPNLTRSTNCKKNFGAIFGGDFRIRTKNNKIKLESGR